MARQPDIQYVQFYTAGSAARKLEPVKRPAKNGVKLPKMRPRVDKRKVIRIDPVSVCAVCVAAVMLVAMAVGMLEYGQISQKADDMEQYAAQLSDENAQLRTTYRSSYDLKDVEQKALEMGLVPSSELQHITVKVEVPAAEPELTGWQEFWRDVTELFA